MGILLGLGEDVMLCDQCEIRKEADLLDGVPVVEVVGGFCTNGFMLDEQRCYSYPCPRFWDWFDRGFFRQPIWYWKTWQEMHKDDGGMVHGYVSWRDILPPVNCD